MCKRERGGGGRRKGRERDLQSEFKTNKRERFLRFARIKRIDKIGC